MKLTDLSKQCVTKEKIVRIDGIDEDIKIRQLAIAESEEAGLHFQKGENLSAICKIVSFGVVSPKLKFEDLMKLNDDGYEIIEKISEEIKSLGEKSEKKS